MSCDSWLAFRRINQILEQILAKSTSKGLLFIGLRSCESEIWMGIDGTSSQIRVLPVYMGLSCSCGLDDLDVGDEA